MASETLSHTPPRRPDARSLRARVLAHSRRAHSRLGQRTRHGIGQLVLGLAIFGIYLGVTHGLRPDHAAADGRAEGLLAAERWLHVNIERVADQWLARHHVLGWLAAWEYATTYIITTFAVLGWIWWRRPRDYSWARNTLIWTTLIAIGCFAVWPTTPPRLLPSSGFVDIVAENHPLLSWGSGTVSAGADVYAAMPSLHIGWAVWVSVVTLRARATRTGYGLALLHLAVTAFVVVATGNHWMLDVVAGAVLVWLAIGCEAALRRLRGARRARREGERVAAADEFFLHVESAADPQVVGGFVLLDRTGRDGPQVDDIRRLVRDRLHRMPRLQQRLSDAGPLRHHRWLPAEVDLARHVREHRLPAPAGRLQLAEFISRLAEQRLDRGSPLWQLWVIPRVGTHEACIVGVMHHAVADGLGVVDILRQLFEPELPPPDLSQLRLPGRTARAAAVIAGAAQLAADGTADQLPVLVPSSASRRYRMAVTEYATVRELARRTGTKVTDVLLAAVGEGLAAVLRERGHGTTGRFLRAAVPMTTRLPAPAGTGWHAQPGNRTAALRLDVPLDPMPPLERLHATAAAARRRRRSGRALAAAAVMRGIGVLPRCWHAWAARAVYNGRHIAAIVSNMPGPAVQMSLGGFPIRDTYPILPLADRVPVGVGTLGWNGQFCLSVLTDAQVLPETDRLLEHTVAALESMSCAAPRVADLARQQQ